MDNLSLNPDPLILYGTQTGTAEELAEELSEKFHEAGVDNKVENMFDIDLATVQKYQRIFVIVSTWGDGEPPDDAEALHLELQQAPNSLLQNREFSVFGLGDTGYEQFCQCGIDFDEYLENLGATRIVARVDADVDFEDDFESWSTQVTELQTSMIN